MSHSSTSSASFEIIDADTKSKLDGGAETTVAEDLEGCSMVTAEVANGDHIFGDISEGDVNYKTLDLWATTVILIKTQLGLGILGIPAVFNKLGLVPGVILLLTVSTLTCWSNYVIGTFKVRHPECMSLADVGMIIAGPIGREILGFTYWILLVSSVAAAFIAASIGLDTITSHTTCSLLFMALVMVVTLLLASIQTLGKISSLGWVGVAAILLSVFTLTISLGVHGRPNRAPVEGDWSAGIVAAASPSFEDAVTSVSSLLFAFAGTPIFMNVASEMKSVEKDYTRALLVAQSFVTFIYVLIGVIVYVLAGVYVSSPALGTAGPVMAKICYGLALPGILVSAIIITHVSGKYVFVRILKQSRHLCTKTKTHYAVWYSSTIGCGVASFLLAAAIPFFSSMISLVGASIGAFLCLQVPGAMWLFDNWAERKVNDSKKFKALVALNVFLVVGGGFLLVSGSYGSVLEIIEKSKHDTGSRPFDCAVN